MRVELRTAGMRPRGALRIAVGAPAERLSTRCVAILAVLVAGCGANAVSATNLGLDAGGDAAGIVDGRDAEADGQSEAGTFACGDALCAETEVCLYPLFECSLPIQPPPDAGSCPAGTVFSADNDVCPGCCLGFPICVQGFSPFCGSPDQCSEQDGGLWSFIYSRLDAGGSSHVCYAEPPP
jgi:hypothetical protein